MVGHGRLLFAMYPNGRVEARAVAPGVPDLAAQEKRDRVPANTYGRLYDLGQLDVAEGLQVQPPSQLWDLIRDTWGRPKVLICDRFRLKELEDSVKNVRLEARVTQWSEASVLTFVDSESYARMVRLPFRKIA